MTAALSDPLETFNRWAQDRQKCPELVGFSQPEAIESAERERKPSSIRILDLDGPPTRWHMDLRPDRLNLVVRDGVVVAAALF